MEVFDSSQSLVNQLSAQPRPLGMVPTMGALHQGHFSLIDKALEENQSVLISIFINPTQFDDKSDFKNYPVKTDSDLQKIKKCGGNIFVYTPKVSDIYGNTVESNFFDLNGLDQLMEGAKRPGHFQGVATIVSHFFEIFQPDNAYFGEKDFQQLRIIQQMTLSQRLNTKIVGCPIIRETDGLAMSSRNSLLTKEERKLAVKLYEGLQFAKSNAKKLPYRKLKEKVEVFYRKYEAIKLDYFVISNPKTLQEVDLNQPASQGRGFVAAYIGKIRLIDNLDMS